MFKIVQNSNSLKPEYFLKFNDGENYINKMDYTIKFEEILND